MTTLRKMIYRDHKAQLLKDAEEVAAMIFQDLGIKGTFLFNDCWNLCKEHGCEPKVSTALLRGCGGVCFTESYPDNMYERSGIALSAHMTFAESCGVMLHELGHRVLRSPRYIDWQSETGKRYHDRQEWSEAVCRAIERRFMELGGTNLLPPRY